MSKPAAMYFPDFPEWGILMGMTLITDYVPLVNMLRELELTPEKFDVNYPGFLKAVVEGQKLLASKRLRPNLVTYINFRLQIWATGFDADGTPAMRVIPSGVATDPNGPTTF